ncbi:osteopetrosis-associated transmembrane protein 1-like [Condylostylus longicornis]|uniref:osteopetrosis-associated transmembrane protein 1-like n=1 Tax=Condylostylus longicornis TaxID=2530218 RepID=UPI00244E31BE|nr:osteopetrosis-associated transmembrane protein 1-like [Condylostylus longicornis]
MAKVATMMRYTVFFIAFGLLIEIKALELKKNKNCKDRLHEYSNSLHQFLDCSIRNAVPVHLCFNCTNLYQEWTVAFDIFMNAVENITGVKCSEEYIDQNQLNIVLKNHEYFSNLWIEAGCFDCFSNGYQNISEETINIIKQIDDFQHCVVKNKSEPCKNCQTYYGKLNFYYNKVFIQNNKNICYDVLDTLNRTRLLWAKTLKCGVNLKDADFGSFAAAVTFTGFFPAVLFYFLSYYFTKRNQIQTTEDNQTIIDRGIEENEQDSLRSEESSQEEEGAVGTAMVTTREAPDGFDDIEYVKSKATKKDETYLESVDLLLNN